MGCNKCGKGINRGMAGSEHKMLLTHEGDEETININKNGIEVQVKITITKDDITLRIEGDLFIITKEDLMG